SHSRHTYLSLYPLSPPPPPTSTFPLILPSHPLLFFLTLRPPPRSTLFPYTTLFRSLLQRTLERMSGSWTQPSDRSSRPLTCPLRSEEHTSELQSLTNLVCRLLLEKTNAGPRARTRARRARQRAPAALTRCANLHRWV